MAQNKTVASSLKFISFFVQERQKSQEIFTTAIWECVVCEVHVCSGLKGALSAGSQQEKQIKSPWLRLLLWHHENPAGTLFHRRCLLLIGWQWSCMLKFESFWSTTEAVATTPSPSPCLSVYCLSHSFFLSPAHSRLPWAIFRLWLSRTA